VFEPFAFLWRSTMHQAYFEFAAQQPSLEDSEGQLRRLQGLQLELDALPSALAIGAALSLDAAPVKAALRAEAAAWKVQFARQLHAAAEQALRRLESDSKERIVRLARRPEGVGDAAALMTALKDARENEGEFERRAAPVEEMYALLARYGVHVPQAEVDAVGDLQYVQRALRRAAADAADALAAAQGRLLVEVQAAAKALAADARTFRADWEACGPAVPGLEPLEAAARLRKY